MNKKSTFDRYMKDPEFHKEFAREYEELVLSELVLQMMDEMDKSVRGFAEEVGVSKTIIQNIRSGNQSDIKLSNFINMARVCGYSLVLEKEDKRIPVNI
jgi:hypothetical protein